MKKLLGISSPVFLSFFLAFCSHSPHHAQHNQKAKQGTKQGTSKSKKKHKTVEQIMAATEAGHKIASLKAPKLWHMSFSGQPSKKDLMEAKAKGYEVVINLRSPDELDYDEKVVSKELGLEYYNVPLLNAQKEIDPYAVITLEQIHKKTHHQKQLIHCSSGNRAAAWFAVHQIVKHFKHAEDAIRASEKLGITKEPIREKVRRFEQALHF